MQAVPSSAARLPRCQGFIPVMITTWVGCIIGAVEKDKIIMGKDITAGDIIIGLPSSGLHTNGYSLVRKIFGETKKALEKYYPELGQRWARHFGSAPLLL